MKKGDGKTYKAYRFRLYPSADQEILMARTCGKGCLAKEEKGAVKQSIRARNRALPDYFTALLIIIFILLRVN